MGSLCSLLPCSRGQAGSGDRQPFPEGHGCSSLSRTDTVAEEVIPGSPNPRQFFPTIWRHELCKSLGQPHGACFPLHPWPGRGVGGGPEVRFLWAASQCSSEYLLPSCLLFHPPHPLSLAPHTPLLCLRQKHESPKRVALSPVALQRSHTSVWREGNQESPLHLPKLTP